MQLRENCGIFEKYWEEQQDNYKTNLAERKQKFEENEAKQASKRTTRKMLIYSA